MITWASIVSMFKASEKLQQEIEAANRKLDKLLKKEPRIIPPKIQKNLIDKALDIGGLES